MIVLNEKFYGVNISRFRLLLQKFGFKNNIKITKNSSSGLKIVSENMDTFLRLSLSKKEIIVKNEKFNQQFRIEIGAYSGYKLVRGLPRKNQRTKTNSRTSRRKNLDIKGK